MELQMKIYSVGGCVRDRLLGRTPKDIDYVVVGATPQQMLDLGFQQVGASFPVFLKDDCEYALARTERKTGVGYTAFDTDHNPNVTLEEDLVRRDLTINSMAWDEETSTLIDPYGGMVDLDLGILRHTSEAFAEDPVRVLRTARFAARYNFTVADVTIELMKNVVHELDHVPAERIWTEMEKGLIEHHPVKMFQCLADCNAFEVKALYPYRFPNLNRLAAVTVNDDLLNRFVLISSGFKEEDYPHHKIPVYLSRVALAFNNHFEDFLNYDKLTTKQALEVLYELRAFSGDNTTFTRCLDALSMYPELSVQSSFLAHDFANAKTVDAGAIAKELNSGTEIAKRIFEARLAAI